MTAASSEFRAKLARTLGMLGSAHEVEQLAAALAAHRLVTAAGLTWYEVISLPVVEQPLPAAVDAWRGTVAECLAKSEFLNLWETRFLHELGGFQRISLKQEQKLDAIAARVLDRVHA
jgi:hypothetical protein